MHYLVDHASHSVEHQHIKLRRLNSEPLWIEQNIYMTQSKMTQSKMMTSFDKII